MRTASGIFVTLAALLAAMAHAEPIELIRPSAGIASIRINATVRETQIHVTFSEDMIPLGGGHGSFPVILEGPGDCHWGWRGPRTLSCLLGQDDHLPLAEKYALVISDGLTSISGKPVAAFRFEFETDRPAVSYSHIGWEGPVSPILYFKTNVPVTARELQRRIFLQPVGQSGPSVRVKVSPDPDPDQYLSAELQFVARPRSALAADTPYAIRVREGLTGIDSGLVGAAHNARFLRTHAAFEYMGIGCGPYAYQNYWEYQSPISLPSKPDCAPEQPVALLFGAEPDARGLYAMLTAAGLPPRIARTLQVRPYLYQRTSSADVSAAKMIYGIRLNGFPAGETNNVVLPATIKDRFGRELTPATAEFPTRNFVPAFLNHLTFGVVASGTGEAIKISTVNSDAVAARLYRDAPPSPVSLSLDTRPPGVNRRGLATLDIEKVLGKPWGVLVGEIAVNERVMQNKQILSGFPSQYATSVGAILSPWDVIVAAKGMGFLHRYSIWVSSLETGEPVSDTRIELLERPGSGRNRDSFLADAYSGGNVLGTARTDDDGYAEIFPTPEAPTNIYPSMLRVTKGDTVVVLPIQAYQFAHTIDARPDFRRHYSPHGGYLGEGAIITWGVTDKPLYRSGETVHIKGYARVRDDNRLLIPAQKKSWKLSCAAYRNDLCTGRTVDLDDYGAFEATLELPRSALDGDYRISVHSSAGGGLPALSFRVANYKPKPHRVRLQIPAERLVGGKPIPLAATVEYFAGGALKNAEAQVIIETRTDSPVVADALFEDYYFGPTRRYRGQGVSAVSQARFDARGRLTGSFPLPANSPASGVATVTVAALHDGGAWAHSEAVSIEYVLQPFLLGLEQARQFIESGEVYDAGVVLIDLQGAATGKLSVVQTLEYPSYRYNGKTRSPADAADRCTVAVTAGNPVSCELTPTRIGRAAIRAKLMRGSDELLQAERSVTVAAPNQRPWYRRSDRLDLELKTDELRANETAEIVVDIPYETATVLFSIRRNFLLQQWRELLSKGKNTIRIPLTEKHAPGFTITAVARPTGSAAGTSIGSRLVKVLSVEELPALTIAADKEDYKVGEQVRLTVTSSAAGKTQLAVAVIDAAVLDLVAAVDDLYDPQGKRFAGLLEVWGNYRWWQLSRGMAAVEASGSGGEEITATAARVTSDSSARLSISAAGAAAARGASGIPLRHDFAEAAYFNPKVLTSDAGIAEISFAVPDNLGRWRVVVIGADTRGQLFANSDGFNVALPLEVCAELPDRLLVGDSLESRATVLNRKKNATDISLSLELEAGNAGIVRESETATVAVMESLGVAASVNAVSGNEVKLIAQAADGEDADGIAITSPVVQPIESRSWTSTAPLGTGSQFVQAIELPANARVDSAELRVTLDKSVIGDLSQTFHYMHQSGHRSWEQIVSRAVVAAYAESWHEGSAYRVSNFEMLDQLTQGSNFQSASGGMSHFEPRDDRANDYLSAYTLLALGWVEDLGFDIPAYRQQLFQYVYRRINLGLRGRRSSYRLMDVPSARDMPIMLAALSSSPYSAAPLTDRYSHYLRSNASEFDVDGLAYALIAATNIGASPELRAELAGRVQARLVETFDRTEISGGDYRFGNRNELYCVVLAALQDAGDYAPEPRALAKLVRGGYEFRDQNSGFGNTHANALCMHAVTLFRDRFEVPQEKISAQVTATNLEPFLLNLEETQSSLSSAGVGLPLEDRRTDVSMHLTSGTGGYGSTNVRYEVDLSKEIERSHGYSLKRSYAVYRGNAWHPVDKGSGLKQGEWVRIQLDVVSPVLRRFVAITDPTPAGLEPVDPALSAAIPSGATQPMQRWDAFNQRALSNEQSRFYAEWLSARSHKVTYYARAKFAGEFLALPAKVESMYSDGVFATTPAVIVRIRSDRD